MNKRKLIISACMLLIGGSVSAQNLIDVSVGTSHQDNAFTNIAFRRSVSDKFRIGIEVTLGSTKYRMVDAKPVTTGSATSFAIPLSLKMYQKDQVRLDFYTKVGVRLHSAPDPNENNPLDSAKSSTAFSFEPGLLFTVKLAEKLNFQSALTFPLAYQFMPSPIFENIYPGMLHFGSNYKVTRSSTLFAKTNFGAALGGSGDTQKFGWSINAGLRFALGEKPTVNFCEPTF
jgi:opacity protein-like surface antigen